MKKEMRCIDGRYFFEKDVIKIFNIMRYKSLALKKGKHPISDEEIAKFCAIPVNRVIEIMSFKSKDSATDKELISIDNVIRMFDADLEKSAFQVAEETMNSGLFFRLQVNVLHQLIKLAKFAADKD